MHIHSLFVVKLLWKEHYLKYVIFFVDNVFTSKQLFHENLKAWGPLALGHL
jgi:hypothetical protein